MEKKVNTFDQSTQSSGLEGVIQRILDIDAQARDVTEKANCIRAEAEKNIAEQKQALKEDYLVKANQRIEKIKLDEKELAEESLKTAKLLEQEKMESLEQTVSENSNAWVDALYEEVIKV